jgi:hypothetical protein
MHYTAFFRKANGATSLSYSVERLNTERKLLYSAV